MENAIQRTRSYNKFKLHAKNRKLNLTKVEKLAKAIDKNNLLPIFPIVVNKSYEILDGQHRFEAAKSVKAEIFYLVSGNNYNIENVANSNNFQSHWKFEDYINYWAKDGLEPYLKLINLAKKYKVLLAFVANIHGIAKINQSVKDGTFEFSNYAETLNVLKDAKSIGVEMDFPYWNKRDFLRAITYINKVNGYNKLRMYQKLTAHKNLLVRCYTAEDYIKLLESIYNLNSIEELRFL